MEDLAKKVRKFEVRCAAITNELQMLGERGWERADCLKLMLKRMEHELNEAQNEEHEYALNKFHHHFVEEVSRRIDSLTQQTTVTRKWAETQFLDLADIKIDAGWVFIEEGDFNEIKHVCRNYAEQFRLGVAQVKPLVSEVQTLSDNRSSGAAKRPVEEVFAEFSIVFTNKVRAALDRVLARLCNILSEGIRKRPEYKFVLVLEPEVIPKKIVEKPDGRTVRLVRELTPSEIERGCEFYMDVDIDSDEAKVAQLYCSSRII